MSDEKKPDHERARKLVAALNEAANTEGRCVRRLGSEACGSWHRLRYCEREGRTCHCCDKHACKGATT